MSTLCSGGQKNEKVYPVLARLAKDFLAIPATSARSEKMFHLASRVISAKRAELSERISSGIMFVRENVALLRKHYARLTEKDVNALPLEKSGIPAPVSEKVDIGCDLFAENLLF